MDITFQTREVDEFEFWKSYFAIRTYQLPEKERYNDLLLDSIALILSGDFNKSPVKGKQRKLIIENLIKRNHNIKIENFSTRIIKPLLKSKILYKSEDDIANGEYSINPKLRRVQSYLKKTKTPNITVKINFDFNGSN